MPVGPLVACCLLWASSMFARRLVAALLLLFAAGTAAANDIERVEGIVVAVHHNDFILAGDTARIVVDVSALGGVTAAIAEGQPIAVIGRMAPDGQRFIALRLESVRR